MATNVLVLNKSWLVTGVSDPEGTAPAPVGSLYLREDGSVGTSVYVKEMGSGATGWKALTGMPPNVQLKPVLLADLESIPASRLLGRGDSGTGVPQVLTIGKGLVLQGTTLSGTATSYMGYAFATQQVEPPASGGVRINAAFPYTAATKVWIAYLNSNSEDLYFVLTRVAVNSSLLIQDKDAHVQYAEFTVTGPVIDKTTYCEVPVAWKANGTALAAQACLVRETTPVALMELEARVAALESLLKK
jgi:hypothetical protein